MNKAASGYDCSLDNTMMIDDVKQREQLSALADGQLRGDEWREAMSFACDEKGQATWELYHLVGDVLRSSELAQPVNPAFMARLRGQLAQEPLPISQQQLMEPGVGVIAAPGWDMAANASVFRWKMVAGFASLAAVVAIGWTSLGALQGVDPAAGAQLASAPEHSVAPVVAVGDSEAHQVMIRDPRLDELLAAHKQFGSTSALQMPAGFLRNATFEAPGR